MSRTISSASLVAAWGQEDQPAFERLVADVPRPRGTVSSWRDPRARIVLGRVPRGPTQHSPPLADALSLVGNCVVAFEGAIYAADGSPHRSEEGPSNRAEESSGVDAVADAYRKWGVDCAAHLHGDFSFVLWDVDRKILLAASDPSGKRCLAYFFDGHSFCVASRVVSLLRHPRASLQWSSVYFTHILGNFWSMPPGITAFHLIRRIRPCHVLLLEEGRLSERRVARFSRKTRAGSPGGELHEEFWQIMKNATLARLDSRTSTCLSLSGGLDSSIVGASMASLASECHAFTLVSSAGTDPGETRAIQALCKRYPNLQCHPVPINDAPVWASVDPPFPITDDPVIDADTLRHARFRLATAMNQRGFQVALDGEGGDELFSMNRRISDLVSDGEWRTLARTLFRNSNRRSLLWRLLAPHLPAWLQARWMRRERRRSSFRPPWLTDAFLTAQETLEARDRAEAWELIDSSDEALAHILEDPVNVGSRSAHRLTAATAGVELLSPMLDEALIDFAVSLPAKVNWSTTQGKPFLRDAAQTRLPAAVLDREKDIVLDQFLRDQALKSQADWPALRSLLEGTEVLHDQVNFGLVGDHLGRLPSGLSVSELVADAGYNLIAISIWAREIERAYGNRT